MIQLANIPISFLPTNRQPSLPCTFLWPHPLFDAMDSAPHAGLHGHILNFAGGSFVGSIFVAMYVEVLHCALSLLHSCLRADPILSGHSPHRYFGVTSIQLMHYFQVFHRDGLSTRVVVRIFLLLSLFSPNLKELSVLHFVT